MSWLTIIILLIFSPYIMKKRNEFQYSWSIYLTHKIRKKISADHIKTQIFLINILFTLIAMPYYILRETRHLKSNFLCKFLYSVTDFIMFVYNNLLILMAVDRFLFICTSIRLDLKRFFRIFYTITIIISSSSLARLLMNDCYEIILDNFVPNCSRYADQEAFFCFREHQNAPKIRNKIFRSSKHWEITKTFIKLFFQL
ncbi:hypothetical protein BpHYR1_013966 [Brachionus plicatilis]|uniref:G-protein coupled receptors family 1 profile domain-containing protein n=1 Tax=Brachionus plicatilis TaxID=10195 RepID=A0A3M7SS73_BRAPC|nr:hypothetical protein BpHYR1_013966 [Brachionus plicatilis]